jgi:NAD(P)-dependent dehydrogenase (short-subunit alcohol dehydrogenase family)
MGVVSLDEVRAVSETNVFGVIAVTQAMLPLLREAPAGHVVNVSSASGSLTLNADPKNPHRSMRFFLDGLSLWSGKPHSSVPNAFWATFTNGF